MDSQKNDNVGKCGHAKCAGGNLCYEKGAPMSQYKKAVVGMQVVLYKVGGEVCDVTPSDSRRYSLQELYSLLGCDCVEFINFPDGRLMIGDEEARLKSSPRRNFLAERTWAEVFPRDKYPINNDGQVYGDVLICTNYDEEV